jgi:hypothetical protein
MRHEGDEADGRRVGQIAGGVAAVDLALQPDMGPGFQLQIAPLFVCFELACSAASISRGVVLWPSMRFE